MPDRIPIPKSVRFEIFKRDSFKCQYCGATAPDVLLHVDHIRPVVDGGTNEITNLVTACQGCNLGKGKRPLSANTAVERSRRQLEELQERREQLELMMEWQRGLSDLRDETLSKLAEFWKECCPGYYLSEFGLSNIRKLLTKFEPGEIISAMRVVSETYLKLGFEARHTPESVQAAFDKIGGVCTIERKSKSKPYIKDLYYLRAILGKRLEGKYYCNFQALNYLENAYLDGVDLETLRGIVVRAHNWAKFTDLIVEARGDAK